ncbi:uncharacterized protein DUF4389 [Kribbella voronezhensis]|uniref:Uncharacterized protein DUF4389 n=1 Tax=Kribbella voronezhensis TaxID=2512212 RepID=A0A4R7SXL6_9ACTN|nr:DUF4389 domain-containing protein [Kribbella voronezhensis]TDU83755.1 uncharacterized protein DUF4389 [Kribbella voronezhensis]
MTNYPVRLVGTPDPAVSRGLWLVKWLLAIPHYIVLAFLWLAFAVLTVVAFFAVLFTGRYPQSIFTFNTGVLRWTWRVGFYAYSALGTDRYPPFTLTDVPDYPARLIVDHPPRLSRGLVLVKWVLAIPHLLVLALLLGGGPYLADRAGDSGPYLAGGGLIGLLVLIAGVVLLFTGRYPRDLFDLIIGLNRWTYRVAGYVFLMTDEYPPFRLDTGPGDQAGNGTPVQDRLAGTTTTPQPQFVGGPDPRPPAVRPDVTAQRWSPGRVVSIIAGALLVTIAFGLIPTGAAGLLLDRTGRDSSGYVATDLRPFSSPGYALSTSPDALHFGPKWLMNRVLGDIRVTGTSATAVPLFIGIAPARDASSYLDGVEHSVVARLDGNHADPVYQYQPGTAPAAAPDTQKFWVASTSGTGRQSVTWQPRAGDWTVVVLNADGSRAVQADLGVGATVPWLDDLSFSLIGLGLLLLLGGAVLIALPLRNRPTPVTDHTTAGV